MDRRMSRRDISMTKSGARRGSAGGGRSTHPSLAVVPYVTLQDGLLRADFANCVTLRITDTLTKVDALRVTSAASAMNLPRDLSIAEIGRQLNVDYVLRGQIVRAEQTLYFTQWLYEGASGNLILEHEVECGIGQLEGFERDVLARVIADVRLPLVEHEIDRIMSKRPQVASAYELTLRAQIAMWRLDRRSFATAKKLLERALQADPEYATAYAWLARHYSIRIGQGWTQNSVSDAREAKRLAEIAVNLDPDNPVALATGGHLASYLDKDYKTGETLLRKAVETCPNEPLGWLLLSATLAYTGRAIEGRRCAEYALTLSPLDSHAYFFHNFAAVCCYTQGDYRQAILYAQRSFELNANYSTTLKALIASQVGYGQVRKAREYAARLRRLEPTYTAEVAARTVPFQDSALRDQFLRQLRTGGCFDELRSTRSARRRS
jgi:adenylate cyclase